MNEDGQMKIMPAFERRLPFEGKSKTPLNECMRKWKNEPMTLMTHRMSAWRNKEWTNKMREITNFRMNGW